MIGTHYGNSMNAPVLYPWAKRMASDIVRKYLRNKKNILPILVYRGMSGVTTATAIMAAIPAKYRTDIGLIYVRKENEESHGSKVEHTVNIDYANIGQVEPVIIFCDDFIDSGATMVETMTVVVSYFNFSVFPADIICALSAHSDDNNLRTLYDACQSNIDPAHVYYMIVEGIGIAIDIKNDPD